ncbi:MAG: hypothetical protein JNK05_17680 [Myxococcales bacterium]|nr:hypothetical protein [Myxococcales bacterium]
MSDESKAPPTERSGDEPRSDSTDERRSTATTDEPRADSATELAEATSSRRPSATNTWTRRPSSIDLGEAKALATAGVAGARKAASALSSTVRRGAGELADGVSRGAGRVGAAFEAPGESEVGALLGDTDLPELAGDPLEAMARRLDREADLWRELSLRALARAAWADRVAQSAAVGAWLVTVATAALALFVALVGGGRSLLSVALVVAAIAGVLAGTAIVAWVSHGVRRTQGALAGAASERAELAELRLQRLGVVLALRNEDVALFHRALARLESDTRGG